MKRLAPLLLLIATTSFSQFVYEDFHRGINRLDEKSYVMYPWFIYSGPTIDWQPGEGKRALLEAKIAHTFTLAHSHYKHPELTRDRHWRLSIPGSVNFRLSNDGKRLTAPSTPPSNKIGLRYDLGWTKNNNRIDFFRADVMHYSNGQGESGYDEDLGRYSYADGDFSTNYVRLSFGSTRFRNNRRQTIDSALVKQEALPMLQAEQFIQRTFYTSWLLYLQRDGHGPLPVLDYLPDDGNYGHWRVGLSLYRASLLSEIFKAPLITYRLDAAIILDELENEDVSHVQATGRLVYHPWAAPWGLMLFGHVGRDYLNIRYTIKGAIIGLGLHLDL